MSPTSSSAAPLIASRRTGTPRLAFSRGYQSGRYRTRTYDLTGVIRSEALFRLAQKPLFQCSLAKITTFAFRRVLSRLVARFRGSKPVHRLQTGSKPVAIETCLLPWNGGSSERRVFLICSTISTVPEVRHSADHIWSTGTSTLADARVALG